MQNMSNVENMNEIIPNCLWIEDTKVFSCCCFVFVFLKETYGTGMRVQHPLVEPGKRGKSRWDCGFVVPQATPQPDPSSQRPLDEWCSSSEKYWIKKKSATTKQEWGNVTGKTRIWNYVIEIVDNFFPHCRIVCGRPMLLWGNYVKDT